MENGELKIENEEAGAGGPVQDSQHLARSAFSFFNFQFSILNFGPHAGAWLVVRHIKESN